MKIPELNNHRDLVLFIRDLNEELNIIKGGREQSYVEASAYSIFKVYSPVENYQVLHFKDLFTTQSFAESSYYCVKLARKLLTQFREEENV